MKRLKFYMIFVLAAILSFSACTNDLEVQPIDPNEATATNVFKDEASYKEALAKIYATYAISGQVGGGGGAPDIQGIDENFGNYLRQYWGLQELPTDEAIMAWDDATIKNFHWQTWAPNDVFIAALYSRIFYTVTTANEFIRTTNAAIANASGTFKTELENYQAEARFLRAFSYWHAIDMFGNVPFVTEDDLPGAFSPERISRADLFTYVEKELIDLSTKLAEPKTNEYGRVDRVSAWMLLAKLYQNSTVYTGVDRNTDALTYLNKVINEGGYTFDPNYKRMFSADNDTSPEIIFPITFDGLNTQQYGGMTFVLHASNGGGMPLNGIDGGWGGIRTIKELVSKFNITESDFSAAAPEFVGADTRGMFYFNPDNWQWEVTNVGTFTNGIGVTKFKNLKADGSEAPNAHPAFVSTDFPVFRLSDAYLMYAESVVRGGAGGDVATAVGYVNQIRERAYGDNSGDITAGDLTLDFLLNERARELYWECHRRTDLIRFGKFTGGDYLWTWKGNNQTGSASESYRDLYPIPSNDLLANPNLIQNDGY
ncbi:RagB/SusD family nutrient uptake outer membrane protein [Ancylomarina longa]|uniref:RagB/SusD family nutrient uptake outer membrane protein n=1 Tax=Ancylomarina longa TaxID=2487017 RepID=A0A434AYL5_9BACT|nr:RagB/SusD family nutrient uptake outer membrane protein [Ancylomarina longa]RUT79662.1 RagB/SusD family nutrient uptake outer membrane protein [Ancylomarina longa]